MEFVFQWKQADDKQDRYYSLWGGDSATEKN